MTVIGIGRTGWHRIDVIPIWLKRSAALVLSWELVVTYDSDGDKRLRRVYTDQQGNRVVRRITGWCLLRNDGSVSRMDGDPCYVSKWMSLAEYDGVISNG